MSNHNFAETILQNLDIFVFAKDLTGKFTFVNENLASISGMDSSAQLIGKSDDHAVWKEQAEFFRGSDQKVLDGNPYLQKLEVILGQQGAVEIITSKNLLKDKSGRICGVVGSFIPCNGKVLIEKLGDLNASKSGIGLGEKFGNVFLTRKEIEVYYYTLLGYSAARIATTICRSKRTVEHHVNQLKIKLQCATHGDLIATASTTGLTYTIFNAMTLMRKVH